MLKADHGRVFLLTKDMLRAKEDERIETVIHPVHAMVLSFFDGTLGRTEATDKAAEYLSVSRDTVENFVDSVTENRKQVYVKWEDRHIVFPPYTIIYTDSANDRRYDPEAFAYEKADIRMGRHHTVNDITLMLTTECRTDCIYCYAAKGGRGKDLGEEKILNLIDEAKALGVRSFDIIGGDVFAYRHGWRNIVRKLYDAGFDPYLSTKVALTEDDIKYLKDAGMKDIQISLDTLVRENLCRIVRRSENYFEDIKATLAALNRHGIKINIHTIVCSVNSSIEDMDSIYDCIKELENVEIWRIDAASYSLPKGMEGFRSYKPEKETLVRLHKAISERRYDIAPIYSGLVNTDKALEKREIKSAAFFKDRILCSALYSHLFILPDGQVTICEQLYWNPRFIVGDVRRQSLAEIWNSPRSMELYNLSRADVSAESACKKCRYFTECRHEMGGVCWKYVVAAYGDEHWDFPDPSCPWAPEPLHDVFVH